MTINGRLVRLRALEALDIPTLHSWANDPALWSLLGGWHFPTSLAQTERWLSSLADDDSSQRFAVELLTGELVGTANLIDIDWKNRHAFHGMMLGPQDVRGRGLGTDTIMAVMRFAFEELGLARLDGAIIEYNSASLRTYTHHCGWRIEGTQRGWYFRQGRYWDRVLVGVTADDYRTTVESNGYWS